MVDGVCWDEGPSTSGSVVLILWLTDALKMERIIAAVTDLRLKAFKLAWNRVLSEQVP